MKKKVLLLLFMLFLILMCEKKVTVEGYLQLFGTGHFPRIAVITEEYGRLYLDLEPERRDSLWSGRGGTVRITGEIYKDTLTAGTASHIRVEHWEWLDNE